MGKNDLLNKRVLNIMLSPELLTSAAEISLLAKGMDAQNLLESVKRFLCFDYFCCGGLFF